MLKVRSGMCKAENGMTNFSAMQVRPVQIGIEQSSATLVFFLLLALAIRV